MSKRIAIQGERGSFHELAVRQYYENDDFELIPCNTFDLTIESVRKDSADLAFMAIENARSGSLLYNYSLLRESGLKIIGEHNLRIEQNLMAVPGQKLSDINEVWSHPVAISQCMAYLKRLGNVRLIETEDTAGSARRISETQRTKVAAIGATIAADIYKLDILERNIETVKMNYTKFLVISNELDNDENLNKASVCFAIGHEPGCLAALLVELANINVNLTKIQSVPRLMNEWEYLFYLDLEFPSADTLKETIAILEHMTSDLEILGIYKNKPIIYDSTGS